MNQEMKKIEEPEVIIIKKEKEIDRIISDHVIFAMVAGAIPVPVLDIAAVTAIQLDMIRQLAEKYDMSFDLEVGKSLVSSIFASSVGTTVGRAGASFVKSIPGIGTVLGISSQVALAGITTFAVGNLFNLHFSQGNPLVSFNFKTVKELFDELLKKGKDFVDERANEVKINEDVLKKQTAIIIKDMSKSNIINKDDAKKILNFFKTDGDL